MRSAPPHIERDATLSACRQYRYALWRRWGDIDVDGYALIIGLNPSTADEAIDDPTARRCIAFARDWGYAGVCMGNLFGYRATKPVEMKQQIDPIGPDNDRHLLDLASRARITVAAWGAGGVHRGRDRAVIQMLPTLHALKLTKEGHPGHPLYLRATLRPMPWNTSSGHQRRA